MTILARCRTNKTGCSVNDIRAASQTPYITRNILVVVDILMTYVLCTHLNTNRVHYATFNIYHLVDTSAGGILVP